MRRRRRRGSSSRCACGERCGVEARPWVAEAHASRIASAALRAKNPQRVQHPACQPEPPADHEHNEQTTIIKDHGSRHAQHCHGESDSHESQPRIALHAGGAWRQHSTCKPSGAPKQDAHWRVGFTFTTTASISAGTHLTRKNARCGNICRASTRNPATQGDALSTVASNPFSKTPGPNSSQVDIQAKSWSSRE